MPRVGSAVASQRVILWGLGYSFLVSQWLSNGSFGSSWLPSFSSLGSVAVLGQIAVYFSYFALLIVLGIIKGSVIGPLHKRRTWLVGGISAIICGNLITYLAGLGVILSPLYILGMATVGVGMTIMMLAWGEYYCRIGAKNACIVLALSFIIGSSLFAFLGFLSELSLVAAITFQLCILPASTLMLLKGWEALQQGDEEVSKEPPFSIKQLVPYLAVVLSIGFILGIVIGLNSVQEISVLPIAWTVGIASIGLLVLFAALGSKNFSLDNLSRSLTPLLVICALLIPLLINNSLELVFIFGSGGYIFARIFYQIAYVSIAQTRKVPVIPLVASAIAADSLGIMFGETLCHLIIPTGSLSLDVVYFINCLAVGLFVIVSSYFLREKSIVSLWGHKSTGFTDEAIEEMCMHVAADFSLTFRETEVLIALAKGLEAEVIAKELNITVNTLRTHARNIYMKLEVHSQPELIRTVVFSQPRTALKH